MQYTFRVTVEYTDGEIKEYMVSEELWFDVVQSALELMPSVVQYTVETIDR